jgi:hypothetical protein
MNPYSPPKQALGGIRNPSFDTKSLIDPRKVDVTKLININAMRPEFRPAAAKSKPQGLTGLSRLFNASALASSLPSLPWLGGKRAARRAQEDQGAQDASTTPTDPPADASAQDGAGGPDGSGDVSAQASTPKVNLPDRIDYRYPDANPFGVKAVTSVKVRVPPWGYV